MYENDNCTGQLASWKILSRYGVLYLLLGQGCVWHSVWGVHYESMHNNLVSLGATFKPRQILASHFIDLLQWGGHLMSILANSVGGVCRYPTHVQQHVPCTITAGIWRGCYSRLDGPQYNQPSRNSLTVQKPGWATFSLLLVIFYLAGAKSKPVLQWKGWWSFSLISGQPRTIVKLWQKWTCSVFISLFRPKCSCSLRWYLGQPLQSVLGCGSPAAVRYLAGAGAGGEEGAGEASGSLVRFPDPLV